MYTDKDIVRIELSEIFGKKVSEKLEKIGVSTVFELLNLKPRKYYKRGELTSFTSLQEGDYVTLQAKVAYATIRQMYAKKGYILQATITDGKNFLVTTFFSKNPSILKYHRTNMMNAENILICGTVSSYNSVKQIVQPEFEIIDSDNCNLEEYVHKPIPVYPATAGFASWKVKTSIETVLNLVDENSFKEIIPNEILRSEKIYSYYEAIKKMHDPDNEKEYENALYSLKYHEAFMLNMIFDIERKNLQQRKAYKCEKKEESLCDKLIKNLPYELTGDQKKVFTEILTDINKSIPMKRMLMADVGAGKTIVALLAMLVVVENNHQAILLAPTEVLAHQHYENMKAILGIDEEKIINKNFACEELKLENVDINILTGSMPLSAKKTVLMKLASGVPGIYIGTHALLSEHVIIENLALVVVDEQHRFGVLQRQKLLEKTTIMPHLLSLSATPIPRSLAIAIFGNTDISVIRQKPIGRKDVKTFLVDSKKFFIKDGVRKTWEERVWDKASEEIKKGGCVYVVVPKISDGKEKKHDSNCTLDVRKNNFADENYRSKEIVSIDKACDRIKRSQSLKNVHFHKMSSNTSSEEKEKIMKDFSDHVAPILVSTTVIEVGVDVKDATMMVILDAHRFGLATLHQLRGRVGRSSKQSYCMLLINLDQEHPSYKKLQEFSSTNDGFKIAELDLKMRKEGDILGQIQSGVKTTLKFLNVIDDNNIIVKCLKDIRQNENIVNLQNIFEENISMYLNSEQREYVFKN